MGYHVFIDKQQDGSFQATCPSMHKIQAHGETRNEALSEIKKLMVYYVAHNNGVFPQSFAMMQARETKITEYNTK